jgi:hypothetical protein
MSLLTKVKKGFSETSILEKGAFGVSIVSLVLAGLAAWWSHEAQSENVAVEITAAASTNSLGSTPAGYAVRVSFVNDSLRPVIIRSMVLSVNKTPVARIASFLLDNRAASDAASLGDEPLEAARSLPVAVAARGAVTLTGLANFHEGVPASFGGWTKRQREALEFCGLVNGTSTGSSAIVSLEIKIDPGEIQTIPVHVTGPIGGGNTWNMDVDGPRSGPTGIRFWRYTSAPSALRLLTVKVWRQHGKLTRSGTLPVVGAGSAEVTFRRLHHGSYRTALMNNHGEVLASGRFRVPLFSRNESVYPSDAQLENGQCLQLKGGRDVFSQPRSQYEHPKG